MWSGMVTMDGSVVVVVVGCYSRDGIKGDNNLKFNVKRKFLSKSNSHSFFKFRQRQLNSINKKFRD